MKLRIEDDAGGVLIEKVLDGSSVLASSTIDDEREGMIALLIDALAYVRPNVGVTVDCIAARFED